MNQAMFVGRIVRPIDVKEVASGNRVVRNTIAIHRPLRNNKGEDVSDFIPIVAWNSQAEVFEKYCKKGDQVAICGKMQSRSYENKEKKMVYVVECNVNNITLLSGNKRKEAIADEVPTELPPNFTIEENERIEEVLSNLKKREKIKS